MAVLTQRVCRGITLLLLIAGLATQASAETLQLQEQEIKAGLLYNFLKYTEWPALPSSIVVCVYGEDPFDGYLRPIAGRTVNQHEITLRMIHTTADAESCHLLFVNADEKKHWPELRKFLVGKSVLTVSDFRDFTETGGMIEFGRTNDHISVELNPETITAAHLHMEDRLLKLATIVHSTSSQEGKVSMRWQQLSIRNILLLTIGTLTLLIASLAVRDAYIGWQHLHKIELLKDAVILSDNLFDTAEKLSVERDIASSMLYAKNNSSLNDLQSRLKSSRHEVDKAMDVALDGLKKYDSPELNALFRKSDTQFTAIRKLRDRIDQAMLLPAGERDHALSERWFKEVTALIQQMQDGWLDFITPFIDVDPIVTFHMRFKYYLGIITEYTGRERSLIGRLIVESADPAPEEIAQLLRWQGKVELSWSICGTLANQSRLAPVITPYLKDAESQYFTVYDMVKDIFYLPGAKHVVSYPISAAQWFELTMEATDSLYALKSAALKETHRYMEALEMQTRRAIITHAVILLFALAICLYSFFVIIRRVIHPINDMVEALLGTIQGKSVSFISPTAGGQDEIGKLAQVLSAFQQNMQDIKRTSAELERYTHALERSNQELDDFAYIASHDLKEPLRGLFNHASFLIEDYQDKLDEDGVRRLHRLSYLSQRMERLVNDLLYFSRLGRTELAIQETDPVEIIHEIEQMMESFLKERNAHVLIPGSVPHIVCDKPRVTEVFRNLITNAVKYNDKPERLVEVGFLKQVDTREGPEQNVFYVRDNGIGIESEFYQEIFRIFKRLQRPTEEKEAGTGVGLTFVKKIIERHGGRIWLDSQLGKGTTFYFNLNQGASA